ncbi:TetR/AcrR family transcriptional regulator, partial [Campylobacter jejuni]
MNSNRTPSQKVLARQEKIKAVALELFLTKGYQETSLSDIIKLSGGSYSNIYNSFKSKEGLFFEILDD